MQNCYNKKSRLSTNDDAHPEQSERLTTRHIQTLKFTQEIANENKRLTEKVKEIEEQLAKCAELHEFAEKAKDRIQTIQDEYLKKADEVNAVLVEKHQNELQKQKEEQEELQQQWLQEKLQLLDQINSLKSKLENQQAADCVHHEDQIQILELKVASLEQELERLCEVNNGLEETVEQQQQELLKLPSLDQQCRELADELEKERRLRQAVLEEMPSARGAPDTEEVEQLRESITLLKGALGDLHLEKASWYNSKQELEQQQMDLENKLAGVSEKLESSQNHNEELSEKSAKYKQEIERLRNELRLKEKERETFKDYVQVKRECVLLREENQALKNKLGPRRSPGLLPPMKVLKDTDSSSSSLKAFSDVTNKVKKGKIPKSSNSSIASSYEVLKSI